MVTDSFIACTLCVILLRKKTGMGRCVRFTFRGSPCWCSFRTNSIINQLVCCYQHCYLYLAKESAIRLSSWSVQDCAYMAYYTPLSQLILFIDWQGVSHLFCVSWYLSRYSACAIVSLVTVSLFIMSYDRFICLLKLSVLPDTLIYAGFYFCIGRRKFSRSFMKRPDPM